MKYNLVLWGTGERTKMCLAEGFFSDYNIIAIIDNNRRLDSLYSIPVYGAENLNALMEETDYLVITNQYFNEILKQCLMEHIDFKKIVITSNVSGTFFSECFTRLRKLSEKFYQRMCVEECRIISTNLSDRCDKNRLLGIGKYSSHVTITDYMVDYFRYRTFEFIAREIKERKIPGELAELGVFRGMFASLINETFPNKKLYLFDTFKGFDSREYQVEKVKERCGADNSFFDEHAKTSEELVLSNMPYAGSCIVCKGLFPYSVTKMAENEEFAFVSLDVDLEESTYQGLNFFYPRLSENGYIFLHDYTTHWLQGVREAVSRYEHDNKIQLKRVPIADRGGTLIITK